MPERLDSRCGICHIAEPTDFRQIPSLGATYFGPGALSELYAPEGRTTNLPCPRCSQPNGPRRRSLRPLAPIAGRCRASAPDWL